MFKPYSSRRVFFLMLGIASFRFNTTINGEFASVVQHQLKNDSFHGSKGGDEREVGGIRLCWCPPGQFRMGSPRDEPERRPSEEQVNVTLSKGFWIGRRSPRRICNEERDRL